MAEDSDGNAYNLSNMSGADKIKEWNKMLNSDNMSKKEKKMI